MDAMKIDKSFLERLEVDGNSVIARAIVAMGQALGMTIVGEGVETAAQLDFLRGAGCEYAQGYFLGRPADHESVSALLAAPVQAAVVQVRLLRGLGGCG